MKLHIDEGEEKELVIVSYCKFLLGCAEVGYPKNCRGSQSS